MTPLEAPSEAWKILGTCFRIISHNIRRSIRLVPGMVVAIDPETSGEKSKKKQHAKCCDDVTIFEKKITPAGAS